MRILFDKGTPRPLRRRLFGDEVETSVEGGKRAKTQTAIAGTWTSRLRPAEFHNRLRKAT